MRMGKGKSNRHDRTAIAAFLATLAFPAVTLAEEETEAVADASFLPLAVGAVFFLLLLAGEFYYARRRLQREKDQRAQLEALINHIPDGIGTFEFDGLRLVRGYFNDSYYRMLGTTREERGDNHFDEETMNRVVHPDDLPAIFGELRRSQTTNTDFSHHYRILGADSHYHWMAMRGHIIQRDGDHMTYLVTMRGEDNLFQSHMALFESETILRAAVADSGLKTWLYDPKSRTASWIAVSVPREALLHEPYLADYPDCMITRGIIHPDDTGEFLELHHRAESGDFSTSAVVRIAYTDGWHWKKLHFTAVADAQGNFTKILGTSVDMDAYKELEDRLRALMLQTNAALAIYHIPERRLVIEYGPRRVTVENAPEACIEGNLVHPEDAEKYREFYLSFARGEESAETILRCRGTTGLPFDWMKLAGTLVRDRDGHPLRAITTGIDISAQKWASQMYENELKYRDMLELEAIWTATADLTDDRLLDYWREGHRMPPEKRLSFLETLSLIQERVASEKHRARLATVLDMENLHRAWQDDTRHLTLEYPRYSLPDRVCWVQLQINLRLQPETNHLLAFLYGRNIDEAKRDRLARERIMEDQADFIGRLDVGSGNFRFLRRTPYLDALHLPAEETLPYDECARKILEQAGSSPTHVEIRAAIASMETLLEYLEDNGELEASDWMVEDGQRRRKRLHVFYQDESRDTVLFQQRDITEIYQEESIRSAALSEALTQAQATSEAKSNFLSRMSHEIRTPMNAIIGLTALTRQRLSEAGYVAESLGKIDAAAHYLLAIINDVLDISRIESGKMELDLQPGSLRSMLLEIDVLIRQRAEEKGVAFTPEIVGDLPEACLFDALKLKQILVNLLTNAVKFTPAGGRVDCSAEVINAMDGEALVRFIVADTGIGIEPEFLPRLFAPFEQESAGNTTRYGGTGLGLAITKNLTELMGGTIRVTSEKGQGTTFTVEITFQLVTREFAETPIVDDESLDFTGLRVLLAEDNDINREIATFILEDKGCEVVPATDGQTALDCFLEKPAGYFGLIFMDIRMPFLDGYSATRAIRASDHPDAAIIPIVAMTANAFEEDARKAYDSGMNGYLTKPVEPHSIYQMVQRFQRKASAAPS